MFLGLFFGLLWVAATIGLGVLTFKLFEDAYDGVDYLRAWGVLVVFIADFALMASVLIESIYA